MRRIAVLTSFGASVLAAALMNGPAASASTGTTVSFGRCAFGSGSTTVPPGPVSVHLGGYAEGTYGLITVVLKNQTTTLDVSGPAGDTLYDLSGSWSAPIQLDEGFWVIRQPDRSLGTLRTGQTLALTYDLKFSKPTAILYPPVGSTGFNGPFVVSEDGPYTCEVTAT
jgi:hypothetical protein